MDGVSLHVGCLWSVFVGLGGIRLDHFALLAADSLEFAFNCCYVSSRRNKRSVLIAFGHVCIMDACLRLLI